MFLRANRDCPGYWTSWAIAPRVPAVHGQSLLCACFKLGTPAASPSQHSLFAGVVVVHRVITAREKELAVLIMRTIQPVKDSCCASMEYYIPIINIREEELLGNLFPIMGT